MKRKLPEQHYNLEDGSKTKFSDYLNYTDERYTTPEQVHTKLSKGMYEILKIFINQRYKGKKDVIIDLKWDKEGFISKKQLTEPVPKNSPIYPRGLIYDTKFRQIREGLKGFIDEDYHNNKVRLFPFGQDMTSTRLIFYQFYINGELELLLDSDYYKRKTYIPKSLKEFAYMDCIVWVLNQKGDKHPSDRIKKLLGGKSV